MHPSAPSQTERLQSPSRQRPANRQSLRQPQRTLPARAVPAQWRRLRRPWLCRPAWWRQCRLICRFAERSSWPCCKPFCPVVASTTNRQRTVASGYSRSITRRIFSISSTEIFVVQAPRGIHNQQIALRLGRLHGTKHHPGGVTLLMAYHGHARAPPPRWKAVPPPPRERKPAAHSIMVRPSP